MKFIITVTMLLLLFSFQTFSQDKNHKRDLLERFAIEKLKDIHKSNVDALEGLNDTQYRLLNSKNSILEQVLNNQQEGFYLREGFNVKNSRTAIKKTLLVGSDLLLEYILKFWDGSDWVNSLKSSNTYDGNNNLIEDIAKSWNGSDWVVLDKISNTYDGNNNLLEWLFQEWDDSDWLNIDRGFLQYDGNNNQTEERLQLWVGSAWMNSEKLSITYDGNKNFTAWLFQIWDGSDWVNDVMGTFTYDGNDNLTEWLGQSWDGSDWADIDRGFLEYDGNNNNTQEFQQDWNGSDWVNNWMESFSYDANNNKTEKLLQVWDGSDWVNDDKITNTYDGNNNLITDLEEWWDGSNWGNLWMGTYLYNTTGIELIEGEINTYSLSNNYPNPFNPSTKIVFQISESEFVTLKVYDILGNEIVSLLNEKIGAGKYEVEFNAANLPSGAYLYVLQAGNFIETKKMLLLK